MASAKLQLHGESSGQSNVILPPACSGGGVIPKSPSDTIDVGPRLRGDEREGADGRCAGAGRSPPPGPSGRPPPSRGRNKARRGVRRSGSARNRGSGGPLRLRFAPPPPPRRGG